MKITRYVCFIRGINTGGSHKIAMQDISREMGKAGFENIITILNSGNVIFSPPAENEADLENRISDALGNFSGFPVPVLVRRADEITEIIRADPFSGVENNSKLQFYVTFLKNAPGRKTELPWSSDGGYFRIIDIRGKTVFSQVDLTAGNTPQAMNSLEIMFGKDITTRNWNTLKKIAARL
jgi:uncharacterized protein (DUF1697 family)